MAPWRSLSSGDETRATRKGSTAPTANCGSRGTASDSASAATSLTASFCTRTQDKGKKEGLLVHPVAGLGRASKEKDSIGTLLL